MEHFNRFGTFLLRYFKFLNENLQNPYDFSGFYEIYFKILHEINLYVHIHTFYGFIDTF